MSDNEDLLGDDLGDHSLADYNLGNDEEDQLLADDYEGGSTQNVPSVEPCRRSSDMVPSDYTGRAMEYGPQPVAYQPVVETECVVPNIVVEVPNALPHSTYAPYEPRQFEMEHSVPTSMPAVPIESPQIVPSEIVATIPNDIARERFVSERPVGAQRMPQVRDIPDSLDKVVIAGGGARGRGRTTWRNPHYIPRYGHPYRHRGNFHQRNSFPPQPMRPPPLPLQLPPQMSHEMRPPPMPQIRVEIPQDRPMEVMDRPMDRPMDGPPMDRPPMDRPPMDRPPMDRPPMDRPMDRQPMDRQMEPRPPFQQFQRFPGFREERPMFPGRLPFERPMYYPRPMQRCPPPAREQEVRMLPVLPPTVPTLPTLPALPGALAGKKVLINPHFKGTFQPVDGPIKDIDDAAERFIAEQRTALARAAGRKYARRSPQRYIENTTIEIENDLVRPRRRSEDDLLRRQEAFIHANRAGLRRRMRSPSPPSPPSPPPPAAPPRRSPSPRERRHKTTTEDSEYKRRVREQETMRERVLRAKEIRRRKSAALYVKMMRDRERDDKIPPKEASPKPDKMDTQTDQKAAEKTDKPTEAIKTAVAEKSPVKIESTDEVKPDTTRKTPDREWTPELQKEVVKSDEVNSTCEGLTPPPPARSPQAGSDDELDLILGDIDGILSDDDDTRREENPLPQQPPPRADPPRLAAGDLRAKLPLKNDKRTQRQKIIFAEERDEKKKKAASPARRPLVSSSTRAPPTEGTDKQPPKAKAKQELTNKSRQRITFDNKEKQPEPLKRDKKEKPDKTTFGNRRVILQRRDPATPKAGPPRAVPTRAADPRQPHAAIFTRAVRTLSDKRHEPEIEYHSDSTEEEDEPSGNTALVTNLPHGMTDTRLNTLAGDVQSLILDKEERSAKITFKTTTAAETFKRKFNNKMVAASRLTVTLQ